MRNEADLTAAPPVVASVDNRGIPCALGIFKVMKQMERLEPGQVLEVLSTDRNARRDLTKWTTRVGHQILAIHEEGNALRPSLRMHIRKKD
jgi:TusA-related sulfurtransferase